MTTPIATTAASISSVDCFSGPLPMLAPAPTPTAELPPTPLPPMPLLP